MTDTVFGVLVTHRRPDELTKSLDALTTQSRALDHLIVVDNDDDERVRDLVAGQPVATTYLGSRRNLGGAGGFDPSSFQDLSDIYVAHLSSYSFLVHWRDRGSCQSI